MADGSTTRRKPRARSPRHPAISLAEAIELARKFYNNEGRHDTTSPIAIEHFGYSSTASTGQRALAALKSYRLLESAGRGRVRLSERALRILLDERPIAPEREKAIQDAALSPAIHRELWDEYAGSLPSDATLRSHLVLNMGFNEANVLSFIETYRQTLEYAKLLGSDTMSSENDVGEEESPAEEPNDMVSSAEVQSRSAVIQRPGVGDVPARQAEPGQVLLLQVPFRGRNLTVRIEAAGESLRQEHVARIIKYLELAKDDLLTGEEIDD